MFGLENQPGQDLPVVDSAGGPGADRDIFAEAIGKSRAELFSSVAAILILALAFAALMFQRLQRQSEVMPPEVGHDKTSVRATI